MRPLTLAFVVLALFLTQVVVRRAHAQSACPTPTADLLWAAAPQSQRAHLHLPTPQERALPARVAEVELTGLPPLEAALAFDTLEGLPDEDEYPTPQSHLWVYTCAQGRWAPLGHTEVEISDGWDGTIDDVPGVVVMRREALAGVAHEFIRLEQIDVNGGYDPRYVRRRFMLFHLVRGVLTAALDVVVRSTEEAGPDREETGSVVRRIVFMRGAPPRYRLTVEQTWVGERPTRCRTILTFDGETFEAADNDCASR